MKCDFYRSNGEMHVKLTIPFLDIFYRILYFISLKVTFLKRI